MIVIADEEKRALCKDWFNRLEINKKALPLIEWVV